MALIAMLLLFFVAVFTYAYLINRQRDQTKLWVSTASILVTQLQTLNVIAKLRVRWPPSAETFFALLIVNGLQLEAARPECLIDTSTSSGAEFPFYHVFNIVKARGAHANCCTVCTRRTCHTDARTPEATRTLYTEGCGAAATTALVPGVTWLPSPLLGTRTLRRAE